MLVHAASGWNGFTYWSCDFFNQVSVWMCPVPEKPQQPSASVCHPETRMLTSWTTWTNSDLTPELWCLEIKCGLMLNSTLQFISRSGSSLLSLTQHLEHICRGLWMVRHPDHSAPLCFHEQLHRSQTVSWRNSELDLPEMILRTIRPLVTLMVFHQRHRQWKSQWLLKLTNLLTNQLCKCNSN